MVSQFFYLHPHLLNFIVHVIKVYDKQNVCFLLYILGQIVTWQYIHNPLD